MTSWACADDLDFYAVKVDPGKERMAVDILENRKVLARVPYKTTETLERINRRVPPKIVERKTLLLVGMIFVAFPVGYEIPWFVLKKNIHIIRGVLGANHIPERFDAADKLALLYLLDDLVFTTAEVAAHKRTYYVGEKVRTVLGPFAGFEGTVDVIDKDSRDITVLFDILGRKTPVRIQADQLDTIEAVAA